MVLTPLAWPGVRNARDLGGLPTVDGGRVWHAAADPMYRPVPFTDPDDDPAEDYAFSSVCWDSPGECEPAAILSMLALVDAQWGGADGYLLAHGLAPAQLSALRTRLRG